MSSILSEIAEKTRERVAEEKKNISPEQMRKKREDFRRAHPEKTEDVWLQALQKPGLSFICEIKKASPSKGLISATFPYREIARSYEAGGADAISCLTEPFWFMGSDEIFCDVRQTVSLPMLRKDFIVDPYQIDQAKVMGADAVLLIMAITGRAAMRQYLAHCKEAGLSALVETHDEAEIADALEAGAVVIGVNNRNLKDFSVDFENALRLRKEIPEDRLFVAESGVRSKADIRLVKETGADACLIGEALMRSADVTKTLTAFRKEAL